MSEKQKLPILHVVQISGPEFERFVIQDQHAEMWTGERFNSVGGTLFARHNDAATEVHNILKANFAGIEPQRYMVPLYVEVYGHEPITLIQVAEYLSATSRLNLNTIENGNGPGNALVLPWIEWNRIERIKEFPND